MMLTLRTSLQALLALIILPFSPGRGLGPGDGSRFVDHEPSAWADSVLATLSLEQKIGQLFVVPATGRLYNQHDPAYRRLVDLVGRFEIGGLIFFRGEPVAQATLTNDLQSRARVPLLVSQDMEWGAGMRLRNTTEFPRAMALGATRDPDLAYAMGRVVAAEARSLGVHVNYAPVADVNNDPDNPVINVRSFGEDPVLVASMAAAYARGLQDGGLIATAKHFPGHGDTSVDSHSGLPVLPIGRSRLDSLELVPFASTIDDGIGGIMIAHIALPEIEGQDGIPATLSPPIVTDILRGDLGFEGLIVTDAMNMHGVTDGFGSGEAAVRSLLAGVDQILMSGDFYAARRAVLAAVKSGRLTVARIDQAVRRTLMAKAAVGLHRYEPSDLTEVRRSVADPAARALSSEIARRSLTLLSNEGSLLPITEPGSRILSITLSDSEISGRGLRFDRLLRKYLPESTIDRALLDRRSHDSEFPETLSRIEDYDIVVVQSYMIVRTGSGRIGLDPRQARLLENLLGGNVPVVLVAFGNPYIGLGLPNPSAFIVAYSSSDFSVRAAAEGVIGQIGFEGLLPVSLPESYPLGAGIQTEPTRLRVATPEEAGMKSAVLARLDTLLWNAIEDSIFPGAAVAIGRAGVVARLDGFGYYTYESEQKTTPTSLFDLASLTKVVATTPAVMLLYDRGLIELDARLASYLPELESSASSEVTVRQVLTHTAGFKSFYPFERMGITSNQEVVEFIAGEQLAYEPDSAYRYSDVGMIIMAIAVERVAGQPFAAFLSDSLYEPLGMYNTGFRPTGERAIDTLVVPTEVDTTFRNRLMQGEVHDERAWILGGTAGHAGLFSTAEDVARYASMLLNKGFGNGTQIFRPETIELFTSRFPNTVGHEHAIGWDTKTLVGRASAGQFFGTRTYGHLGFTGTSLWIDPEADLFAILLTNRVYPTRGDKRVYDIQPEVADIAFLSLTGDSVLDLRLFEKEPFQFRSVQFGQ
jgi:beta-glucosidase-like glycosyl hydrolase/CubicO group peptidase (beta-lactamase class C family)